MHGHDHGNSGSSFALGAIIGGLIGAAAALLLAPKSGEETRAEILQKASEIQKQGKRIYKEYEEKAEDQVKRIGKEVTTRAKAVGDRIHEGMDDVQDKAARVARELKR